MSPKTILILAMFSMLPAAAQDPPRTRTQCRFPDGNTITVSYSPGQFGSTRLATDEDLVTIGGRRIPAGDYAISPAKDSENNWTLTMRKQTRGKGASFPLPPLPMSITRASSPIKTIHVSFAKADATCTMLWGLEKSNVLLSLEFTEMNTDMPLVQE